MTSTPIDEAQRRRRIRRMTLTLFLVAVTFYGSFILLGVLRG